VNAPRGPDPAVRPSNARPGRRALGVAMLSVWAVVVLVVGAALMAPHVVALPVPAADGSRLALAMHSLPGANAGRWSALHVLYEGCGCSARVLTHLMARHARADLNEQVLFVRDAPQADPGLEETAVRARGAGFGFASVTPGELEQRYQIEAVPLLVVADAAGHIRYSGGYTEKSGVVEVDDVPLIDGVRSGRSVEARPVFGCAVSSRMQEAIDPWRIKYSRRN
jgi:hypothetical protein